MGKGSSKPVYKNKKAIALVVALLVLLGFVLLRSVLSGEAEGTVNNTVLGSSAEKQAPSPVNIEGKYISFSYLDNYHNLPVQKPAGTILESFDFNSGGFPSTDLAVSVLTLPGGNLDNNSSYQLRTLKTAQYKKELWQSHNSSYPVFSDVNENYSKVAFITKGDKLVTVALSGGGNTDKLIAEQKAVIDSLEWKN